MHVADTLNVALDGLESLYSELVQVSQERDYLSNDELEYVTAVVSNVALQLGGTANQILPSLESDNYFERNDIQVSMEAIGEAIKSGAKAALQALIKLIRSLCERVAERFKSLSTKFANLRKKAQVVTQASEKAKTTKAPAPTTNEGQSTTNPQSQEPAKPLVTKFAVQMTLLEFDGVADKVTNAASMNAYVAKLSSHLSNLTRDFSTRMDYGSDTNNFAVDSMKALQNVTTSEQPIQIILDVSREASAWERWRDSTLPYLERTFAEITKKDVMTKMNTHYTNAERLANTEKDEAKLAGYRQRINELGKMIKTFDILLAAISSVDIKPASTPPPVPGA